MANHITNDMGEVKIACGAPGSLIHTEIKWPALIERLQGERKEGATIDCALDIIRDTGAEHTGLTAQSLLILAGYDPEEAHTAAHLLGTYKETTYQDSQTMLDKALKGGKSTAPSFITATAQGGGDQ